MSANGGGEPRGTAASAIFGRRREVLMNTCRWHDPEFIAERARG
jgi:hypothetical protein